MQQTLTAPQPSSRIVEYDPVRGRLWIFGQRCHHGATGSAVVALACAGLIAGPLAQRDHRPRASLAALAAGGALMAHDWKDHSIWFKRGYGSQP